MKESSSLAPIGLKTGRRSHNYSIVLNYKLYYLTLWTLAKYSALLANDHNAV